MSGIYFQVNAVEQHSEGDTRIAAGTTGSLGKNTDCYDITSSHGVTIENSVCNTQDVCLEVRHPDGFKVAIFVLIHAYED